MHFRTLSGGEPHPMASKAIVDLLKDSVWVSHPSALLEVVGDYVALLLRFPNFPTDVERLYLVDWRKGNVHLVRRVLCSSGCFLCLHASVTYRSTPLNHVLITPGWSGWPKTSSCF
jgi:hypothetical protein